MDTTKLHRGDKVRVISNDYIDGEPFHYFNVGDVVTVKRVLDHWVKCTDKNGLEQTVKSEHIGPAK